jgi:hypothetical protein
MHARLDELSGGTHAERAENDERSLRLDRLAAVVGHVTADADALLAAAVRLRAAVVTADAAARVVGDRPSTVAAEIELVRARSLVPEPRDADGAAPSATAGAVAMSAGGALVLIGVGLPVAAGAVLPVVTAAGLVARWRRSRRAESRLRAEADAAAAVAERAHAAWERAVDRERVLGWRADAAAAASAELDAARAAWAELVGSDDVRVECAERRWRSS